MTDAQNQGLDKIAEAVAILRGVTLPPGFLEVTHSELVKACLLAGDPGFRERCYCYLMFFGANDIASFMKIGVAKNPVFRLAGLTTGNPLEPLWTFAIQFETRKQAMQVEKALHEHHKASRAKGEWFAIPNASQEDAWVLAECAARFAARVVEPIGPMTKVA